ncbi:major facilitator superfamily domain-containing protein [Truncatella angustata]|uniref:Major facilitator superfamily domain-containing protein n=1 Tax=Truncatella angustata TaxID=152316 RepID=A0A9P8UT98_9PEZI|nr:major facilitator superfamily domain-containing protein [Truncatella angustata]KAH6657943.1 major facilitator superfamily domain-containing protein [Truncatella angustata]
MEAEKKEGLARLGILEVLSYDEDPDRAPDGDEAELSKEIALKQLPITRALLMGALYAALYLPTLNQTVVSNALPKILSDINKFGSDIGYTWVGSVYSLAQAMALPLFGQLGHTPGRKWALLVAMGIFMLGSTLCGTAVNIQMLLAARTVQGLGAGGISGLIFVLMADMVRVKGVGKYTELYAAVCAVITAVGPLVGGALAETANWRWCFFMNLPICALCTIIILILLPRYDTSATVRRAVRMFDLWGVTAIGLGKVLIALAIQWAIQDETWNSPQVLVSLLSGVAALVAFVPSEMSAESPVIPFRFFKHRTRIGAYMAVFFHSVAFSGLNYWLPMYFQAVRQQTSSDSGLSMLPWTLSFAVMSAAAGIFVVAMRRYQEFIWSGFFVASVAFACLTLLTSDTSTAITSLLLVIAGLGVGPNFNTPLFPVHASFDMSDSDYAATLSQSTSAYAFLRSLGSSIGITASGLVFFEDVAQHQSASLTVFNLTQAIEYSELLPEVEENANVEILHTAMQHVFIQVCVCMCVGLLLSFFIGRHQFSNEPEEDQDDDGEGARTIPRVDSFGTEDG